MDLVRERYQEYLRSLANRPGLWEVNGEVRRFRSVQPTDEGRTCEAGEQTVLYARAGEEAVGYAVSGCPEEEPVTLLAQAAENGRLLKEMGGCITAAAVAPAISDDTLEEEEMSPFGALREAAGEERKVLVEAGLVPDDLHLTLTEKLQSQWVINQKGLDRAYQRRMWEAHVYYGGHHYTASLSAPGKKLITPSLLEAIEDDQKNKTLPKMAVSVGDGPAVVGSRVMAKLWITLWQAFGGQRYVEGTSAVNGLLGKALAAPIVNVLDTPAYEESGYQKPFDCEGTTGVPVHLIQNGRLEGLLHHCESAQQLGQQPTGNAGRTAGLVKGVSRIITPRSLVMQPGNTSVDELLKQLENGYYIYDAWDEFHAVNVASGDFHFPCSAVRIEHGQRVGVIEGLTFSGNIREFLPEITALGRDLCFMPLLMHETYQVAAPAVLVSEAHLS